MIRLRDEGLMWQWIEDDIVVLDLDSSKYFRINGSGALLWERLASETSEDDLVELLTDEYEISDTQARADVDAFIAGLEKRRMLARD